MLWKDERRMSGIFSEYKSNPRKRIREGLHTSFYANGKDSLTEVYRDNRLEGQTMVYYPDGAIHLARSYSDGKLDGTLLQYYPDGKLRRGGTLFRESVYRWKDVRRARN